MRLIGQLDTPALANRFCDYLLTREIDAHVEEGSDGRWQVWIEHDDDLDQGKAELSRFTQSPDNPEYDARGAAAKIRQERLNAAVKGRKRIVDVRTQHAAIDRLGTPVAILLIVLSSVVFLLQTQPGTGHRVESALAYREPIGPASIDPATHDNVSSSDLREKVREMVETPWTYFDSIRHGQVWRLVSPMFPHGSITHLIFNMMWLWTFGQRIERRRGSLYFLMLILVGSACSMTMQMLWYQWYTPHVFQLAIGMSGVNYALFGFLWINGRLRPWEGLHVSQYDWGLMIGWLFAAWLIIPNVANIAHLGGLLTGMGLACLQRRRRTG